MDGGTIHLHLALTTVFVLLLVAASVASLLYTYVKTSDAALRSARQMMKQTNTGIYRDVLRYLGTAKRTTTAMTGALKDVRSVHDDHEKILPLISGQLKAQREVFGISDIRHVKGTWVTRAFGLVQGSGRDKDCICSF